MKKREVIETQRFYLKELGIANAPDFFSLNNDPEVLKYTGDRPFEQLGEAESFLETYNPYKKYGYGRWAIYPKGSQEFLGWCGLKYSFEKQETDIGFRLFRRHWGKGIASETALASLEYGFRVALLPSIVGRAMIANVASIRVLEKIGMSRIGSFKEEGFSGDLFRINSEEFFRLNSLASRC